jgi:hypothetical protein
MTDMWADKITLRRGKTKPGVPPGTKGEGRKNVAFI